MKSGQRIDDRNSSGSQFIDAVNEVRLKLARKFLVLKPPGISIPGTDVARDL